MELKWPARHYLIWHELYEFLASVNQPAAARAVQSVTKAPIALLINPRIGEQLFEFEPREIRRILVGDYEVRYMKLRNPLSMCCDCGTRVNIGS